MGIKLGSQWWESTVLPTVLLELLSEPVLVNHDNLNLDILEGN